MTKEELKRVFEIFNDWVYNDINQAGVKLNVVVAEDFPEIFKEIEGQLLCQPTKEKLVTLTMKFKGGVDITSTKEFEYYVNEKKVSKGKFFNDIYDTSDAD